MTIAQHSSKSVDHGTPSLVIEAAKKTLGTIDLDPASSQQFNQLVGAKEIYTKDDNGYLKRWLGNVFLNPPGGYCDKDGRCLFHDKVNGGYQYENGAILEGKKYSAASWWWKKLSEEYNEGRVKSAIFIGFTLEILQRAQLYCEESPAEFPMCIPQRRLKFNKPAKGGLVSGDSPPHANVIVYLPGMGHHTQKIADFQLNFQNIGVVTNVGDWS